MWDFKLGRIITLMRQTYPFLVFRFLIYTAITAILIAITGGGAGIGWIGGVIVGEAGPGLFYGGIAGAGASAYFLYFIREYLLYQVKAGHIALLVRFMEGKPVPEGKGMVVYAKEQVQENFKESNVLFAVDQLIKGVLKVISGLFNTAARAIPIPVVANIIAVLNKILAMSLTYVDEIILAYHMKHNSTNVWTNSCNALVLYTQNYGKMLKNAFWVSLLSWGLTLLVFVMVLSPFAALTLSVPSLAGPWTFAIAGLLAWGVKSAVIDPIAMTALMQVYFETVEGQNPVQEWEQRLEKLSGKFRELKERGMEALSSANPFGAESSHSFPKIGGL